MRLTALAIVLWTLGLSAFCVHVADAKGKHLSVSFRYHSQRHKKNHGDVDKTRDSKPKARSNNATQKRRSLLGRQPKQVHFSAEVGQKKNTIVISRVRQAVDKASTRKQKGKKKETASSWALKTDSFWGERRRPKHFKIQIRLSGKNKDGSRKGVKGSSTRRSARKGSTMVSGRFSATPRRKVPVTSLSGAAVPPASMSATPELGLSAPSKNRKIQGPAASLDFMGSSEGRKIVRFGAEGSGYEDDRISTGVHQIGIGIGHHPADVTQSRRAQRDSDVGSLAIGHAASASHRAPSGREAGRHHPPGTTTGHHVAGAHPFSLEHAKALAKTGTRSVSRHHTKKEHKGRGRASSRQLASGRAAPCATGHCGELLTGQTCDGNQTVCDVFSQSNPGWDTCCGRVCRNLQVDELHCGSCSLTCPAANMCCSGSCKDIQNDVNNCGACFVQCSGGALCVSGVCEQYGLPGRR